VFEERGSGRQKKQKGQEQAKPERLLFFLLSLPFLPLKAFVFKRIDFNGVLTSVSERRNVPSKANRSVS
jgi:hypothetical protein